MELLKQHGEQKASGMRVVYLTNCKSFLSGRVKCLYVFST
uniref:Uncharacterized protein n=1 Tax=Rhizophora mucronata TaxID=61149 RepID=A0A2P2IV06_RHIMU